MFKDDYHHYCFQGEISLWKEPKTSVSFCCLKWYVGLSSFFSNNFASLCWTFTVKIPRDFLWKFIASFSSFLAKIFPAPTVPWHCNVYHPKIFYQTFDSTKSIFKDFRNNIQTTIAIGVGIRNVDAGSHLKYLVFSRCLWRGRVPHLKWWF